MGSGGIRFLGAVLLVVTCGLVGLQSCSTPSSGMPVQREALR